MESIENSANEGAKKIPEWTEQKLNSHTNLENFGDQNIGTESEVTYLPEGSKQSVTVDGIVLQSTPAQIKLQDRQTGKITKINTNWDKIGSIHLRQASEKPTEFRGVSTKEVFAAIQQGQPVFGRCIISIGESENENDILVAGEFRINQVSEGYEVIEVVGSDGVRHLVDPDRVHTDFALTSNKDDLKVLCPVASAVEMLDSDRGERIELARELVEGLDVLDNEKYYEYFQKDPARAKEIFLRWYDRGQEDFSIEDAIRKFERLGTEYVAALADPGIVQHSDDFVGFADQLKGRDGKLPSCVELRRQFAKHLGTETVYRGMMLTQEELKAISESGIVSPALLRKDQAVKILQETLDPAERQSRARYSRDIYSEMRVGRLTDLNDEENSTVISVSAYEPVAGSVGYYCSGQVQNPQKQMYVFKLGIPRISLIKQENVFEPRKIDTVLTVGRFEVDEETDREVEMFVPYSIPAKCIKNCERLDKPPVRWDRYPNSRKNDLIRNLRRRIGL